MPKTLKEFDAFTRWLIGPTRRPIGTSCSRGIAFRPVMTLTGTAAILNGHIHDFRDSCHPNPGPATARPRPHHRTS